MRGNALSFKTVYRWISRFKSGNFNILDEPHTGRIPSCTDTYYVEKVKELLDTDRRYSCEEIATNVGISTGSAHKF